MSIPDPAERTLSAPRLQPALKKSIVLLPAVVLLSVALGGSTAAAESGVTCGSVVTTDVTLTADLYCPSGEGLVLDANVTLDLGGHRLVGPGFPSVGVVSPFEQGGNTIRNGTIENWGTGILLGADNPDGVPYVISDVTLLGAGVNLDYLGSTGVTLTRVTAVDSPIGVENGGHVTISQSTLTRSFVNPFYAGVTITDSTLVQSSVSASSGGDATIDSSRLDGKGTGSPGYVDDSRMTITNSIVRDFAEPLSGFAGSVTLIDNTFRNMPNGVLGDISSDTGSDDTSHIVGNTFTRSGVVLRGNVPMIVEDNIFKQNEVGVIFTRAAPLPGAPLPTAEGSRAAGNVLTKSTGTGIQTDLPGLAVGDNTATKNGGFGIYAPGAVDLGGNVAWGNRLGQCVGVVCAGK